jgi:hypothetical protein
VTTTSATSLGALFEATVANFGGSVCATAGAAMINVIAETAIGSVLQLGR